MSAGELPDLGALKASGSAEERLAAAEKQEGMRCHGCGERITSGYEFVKHQALADGSIGRQRTAACSGINGCDYASRAGAHADAMSEIRWLWLDAEGLAAAAAEREVKDVG